MFIGLRSLGKQSKFKKRESIKQVKCYTCMLSLFSRVGLFATLWTVALQAPLSMGFSRQEYWSGFPCPPAGDLPNPGIEPRSPAAPALQLDCFTAKPQCGRPGFNPWVRKSPWKREWQPTPSTILDWRITWIEDMVHGVAKSQM